MSPRKKVYLVLLNHRLGHISTRSLMAGDNENFWQDIELRRYTHPFCTSCQISSINKKDGSKNPLKPKSPFKYFLMGIITATYPKRFDK